MRSSSHALAPTIVLACRTFELEMSRDDALFRHGIEAYSVNSDGDMVPFAMDVHNYLRGTVKVCRPMACLGIQIRSCIACLL